MDKFVPAGQDLFSHPYADQWQGTGESADGRNVSRKNLFSEPAEPGALSGGSGAKRPPRDPFGVN